MPDASPLHRHPAARRSLCSLAGVVLPLSLVLGLVNGWASPAAAGKYNAVLSVGDVAPQWKDLPGVDGRQHSWEDVAEAEVVVVVFTCNTCPYAVDVEQRLVALDEKFADPRVAIVAINANTKPDDRLPAMRDRAEEQGFEFPYLHDASQDTARAFGATTTPQFFVLDDQRRVVYMGSLDDSPDGKNVTNRYVEAAIEAALAGTKPKATETVPVGCRIRFPRRR
ncbi:thioredoxin family protein [Candidatus Laterigemmans baculatus]|uniref:thioredoxin family protein n=1 Tax=Candidatus Laterigemmans baculatus TaxID=2770505 RepID=UPI0028F43227|nr:thioredoxin family protein [Candidatus Laterigemmans baculatus]